MSRADVDRALYQIRVAGHLDDTWLGYFEGMSLRHETKPGSAPTTLIEGLIQDQAALNGVLNKITDLGLQLLYVKRQDKR